MEASRQLGWKKVGSGQKVCFVPSGTAFLRKSGLKFLSAHFSINLCLVLKEGNVRKLEN
jgi:hypothetical protein